MAGLKTRQVKGKAYQYVYSRASFKGEVETFEKSIGPKSGNKKELERKKEFYSAIVDAKKEYYLTYLETKDTKLKYLEKGYAFPLVSAKRQYHEHLKKLYPSDLEKYKDEFEVRYVFNTTTIEGNTLTLKETAMILDKGLIPPKTKELREIHEVENYKRVRSFVMGYKKDMTLKFICQLHKHIQQSIDDDSAGCLRRIPIYIQGSEWTPPPAIVVEEELEELLLWYNKNKKEMHPVELAGVFHHRFVQIHPFKDGNGRVAREVLNFILERNGFPPVIVPVSRGLEYFEALGEADKENKVPLLEFITMCIVEDYAKALFSVGEDIQLALGELTERETRDFQELVMWYIVLIREFLVITPEKIGRKLMELFGITEEMNPLNVLGLGE